ncbi:hypothetical protein AWY79_17065 [Pseudodesulfovibrio indicus]|uniref:Uncharacterized protein n=1 Tax=Pseudodesulfovibrio indicus TaxID=1716143 RepID=A0ABM5YYM6_9BACT|nr:hypothetical protein AWY79_17065 [Pseudodesulfovibrio indicus]
MLKDLSSLYFPSIRKREKIAIFGEVAYFSKSIGHLDKLRILIGEFSRFRSVKKRMEPKQHIRFPHPFLLRYFEDNVVEIHNRNLVYLISCCACCCFQYFFNLGFH